MVPNETGQALNETEHMLKKGMILKRILLYAFPIFGPRNGGKRFVAFCCM